MNLKTIFQGFGAAILVLILRVWPQLSSYHPVIYHSFLPMPSVIWGVLIDLGVVTFLAALLFGYLEKSETGLRTAVWAFVAAELASALVTAGGRCGVRHSLPQPWTGVHRNPARGARFCAGFGLLPTGVLYVDWLLLMLAGCSVVWMIPELFYLGLRAQRTDAGSPMTHPMLASKRRVRGRGGRIVWLLFDELSYNQTFDHRFPGLAMPALTNFKSQSVLFSDLKPAGYYTDRVIPSFFLGTPVDKSAAISMESRRSTRREPAVESFRYPCHAILGCPAARLDHGRSGLVQPLLPHSRGNTQLLFLEHGRRPIRRSLARPLCLPKCHGAASRNSAPAWSISQTSPRKACAGLGGDYA